MDFRNLAKVSVARDFFSDELKQTLTRQKITTDHVVFEYLVNLLLQYLEADHFYSTQPDGKRSQQILANLYLEYRNGNAETKKQSLQKLGDFSLFVSGFFSDSIKRKLIDIDYYQEMGGAAYSQLSKLSQVSEYQTLYEDLAEKFIPYSDVFSEMSERANLQNNKDILRLYEKWILTGSDRIRKILSEKGIIAVSFSKNGNRS